MRRLLEATTQRREAYFKAGGVIHIKFQNSQIIINKYLFSILKQILQKKHWTKVTGTRYNKSKYLAKNKNKIEIIF